MDVQHILKAIGFLALEIVGIPGNIIMLACFLHYRIFNDKLKPIDMLLFKLSFINLVVVSIQAIPQSITSVRIQNVFNEQICDIIIFLYHNFRAMSICMTSLLSCYQWAVVAPSSCLWDTIKGILIHKLSSIMISLWCLNIFLPLISKYAFPWELALNSTAHVLNLDFCLIKVPSHSVRILNGTISLFRDLLFIFLMIISSMHIVIILYQHRLQVKSIRSSDQDQKVEIRAAKAVLLLILTYIVFFGLDNVIWIFNICAVITPSSALTFARVFFSSCFCALSPIVIIATNKKMQQKLRFLNHKINPINTKMTISHENN